MDKLKYGAFSLRGSRAHWNFDDLLQVDMQSTEADPEIMEGIWNPHSHMIEKRYKTAISGLCIWAKYDCVFTFKPLSKANPGAVRSLSSPKDKADILRRLSIGQNVDSIIISALPFGHFQNQMIAWQADVVSRYHIEKLYYSLPVEEYMQTILHLESFLSASCISSIYAILNQHHDQLESKIKNEVHTDIEFIHPLRDGNVETVEQSYAWPYQELPIDLGIEEMEEVRIPYQVLNNGYTIPPIILGLLGFPCPYYERQQYNTENDYIKLVP